MAGLGKREAPGWSAVEDQSEEGVVARVPRAQRLPYQGEQSPSRPLLTWAGPVATIPSGLARLDRRNVFGQRSS